jgi:serine/threonine protein kinase
MEAYVAVKTLADSLFGKVKLCRHQDGTLVAIKMSSYALMQRRVSLSGCPVLEDPMQEITVLKQLAAAETYDDDGNVVVLQAGGGHPNVLLLVGELLDLAIDQHWMVLEYVAAGEFFNVIAHGGKLTDQMGRHYFRQIMAGVNFIHQQGIVHLDLSLENVLHDGQGLVKICDFGLAHVFQPGEASVIKGGNARPGKQGYMSPQIFCGQDFDGFQSDVWSCGVMLFIMMCGVPPFSMPHNSDGRFKFIYGGKLRKLLVSWQLMATLDEGVYELLFGILAPPERRINVDNILAHSWIAPPAPIVVVAAAGDSSAGGDGAGAAAADVAMDDAVDNQQLVCEEQKMSND